MQLSRKAARYTCLHPELALQPFRSRYHQVISWAAAVGGVTATLLRKNVEAQPMLVGKAASVGGAIGELAYDDAPDGEPS